MKLLGKTMLALIVGVKFWLFCKTAVGTGLCAILVPLVLLLYVIFGRFE